MAYRNQNGGSREMAMYISYVLSTEFRRTQNQIRENFGVSQSTVHNWIRDVDHRMQITSLQRELDAARSYIVEQEAGGRRIIQGNEPLLLPDNSVNRKGSIRRR
jgi:DNA-binding MarR family transcriptional regulator